MKREILCQKCEPRVREVVSKPYPGEYDKFMSGHAKADFLCDHCAEPISTGQFCWAMSIWTDRLPYTPWELEYIE
jgi:hypothetical protein